ncbi:lipopolysaccharide biosynthesis protein [Flavobacterium cerinum]|uniref:Oligosaccharide flippase family protein n=1 Tax=Flavobacterium cerinum TaxID=2502784 RepID=A0ABY5ITV3_9FLAO|nr:oligosaccharide flippase family protein [Flavobacterium cerinum]UUC46273.1 oligosaccharide flippase family protein [Flavobacterium cerinum]
MSGFYKGGSGLALFISIPLLIQYLGNEDYGIWVLVFTVFQWVLLMDFGIQSALKTKIPILLHNNETELIKGYIKSTYKYGAYIALCIFILATAYVSLADIKEALNISFHTRSFVWLLFTVNIFFFCSNLIAGIHKSLYVAYLKGKYAEESLAVNQFGFLFLFGIAMLLFPDIRPEYKLLLVSVLNGGFCLLVNIGYTIRFFKMERLNLNTELKPPKEFIRETLKIGMKFMVIQLGMILFFTVDNYIISNNFSPKDVVPYDSVNKIFQLPVMVLFAALSPMWSMFAKDYIEKNQQNLLSSFKRFNLFFIGILVSIAVLALICPFLIAIWIKEPLAIPDYLILLIAIITAIRIFTTFYTNFLNGIGKLNRYTIIIVLSLIIKIPLTYFLISLGYGINSVALSTVFILFFWIIFIPYECYSIIRNISK